jgi:hypothetical protein
MILRTELFPVPGTNNPRPGVSGHVATGGPLSKRCIGLGQIRLALIVLLGLTSQFCCAAGREEAGSPGIR